MSEHIDLRTKAASPSWLGRNLAVPAHGDGHAHAECLDHRGAAASILGRINQRPLLLHDDHTPPTEKTARRRIWDLHNSLHCSVIGTCLTTSELRALLGKFHGQLPEKPTEHLLHTIAVTAAAQHNLLAKQLQKALDRRHTHALRHFAGAKNVGEVRQRWHDARQAGDIPGGYWAVLTHPKTDDVLLREAFGDVHMLSHLVGAANRADIRKLHELEEEKAALEEKLARQQAQLRDGIVAREAKIRELNATIAAMVAEQSRPAGESTPAEIAVLHGVVADLRKLLDREVARRQRAEARNEELTGAVQKADRARVAADREFAALRAELDALESHVAARDTADETEAEIDLDGAALLYVGGRPHQIAQLRQMIEAGGGQLIHHDGGVEERSDLLPGLVSRADAAFFPVDCISHSAALLLKRLCQQAGKPYVPLRSAGVASMLRALRASPFARGATASAAE
jgi:hypothetical protein